MTKKDEPKPFRDHGLGEPVSAIPFDPEDVDRLIDTAHSGSEAERILRQELRAGRLKGKQIERARARIDELDKLTPQAPNFESIKVEASTPRLMAISTVDATTKPHPLSFNEQCKRFGVPSFKWKPTEHDRGNVVLDPQWLRDHIVRVEIPQLERLKFPRSPVIKVHKAAAGAFVELWQRWDAAGLLEHVQGFYGSFVPRYKRGHEGGGSPDLSRHSWGTAMDLDAPLYPLGKPVAVDAPIRKLVPIANELGFAWGGDFHSRIDGMHFEYVRAADDEMPW